MEPVHMIVDPTGRLLTDLELTVQLRKMELAAMEIVTHKDTEQPAQLATHQDMDPWMAEEWDHMARKLQVSDPHEVQLF